MKHIDVTINRIGSFRLPRRGQMHKNQCGTTGVGTYKYKVSITGSAAQLDKHGFLIDNMVVRDYFVKTYEEGRKKSNSCELMACAAIKFIQGYCKKYGLKHVRRIYVEIWGAENSYIIAEWNRP